VLRTAARKWRPAIHAVVGGEPIEPQLKFIEKGVAVLVGTPGRVLDLMRRQAIVLKHVQAVVLDEADEMLLRGFKPDLDAILAHLPTERQTILVSATVGSEVRAYAAKTLRAPQEVGMGEAKAAATLAHHLVMAPRSGKGPILEHLLREHAEQAIVFVHKIEETKRLAMRLRYAGIEAAYLSGDLPQENRKETMERFRKGVYRVLVATDVASRGLDIPEVGLVVNYSVPPSADQYIHRAGRTGRAGRQGRVVTLSYREEAEDLKRLRQTVALEVLKVVPKAPKTPPEAWRPPLEEAMPQAPGARAKRPPKIQKHLGWFEDRPLDERRSRPSAPTQPRSRSGKRPR
ncbi:MAG TPA: DEAD/DEAH box helicase, partial [Stenomitos sp.]